MNVPKSNGPSACQTPGPLEIIGAGTSAAPFDPLTSQLLHLIMDQM